MIDQLDISYVIGESVVKSMDNEVDPDKTYLMEGYNLVVTDGLVESPSEKGWYELVDNDYILSSSNEIDPEVDYYSYGYSEVEPVNGDSPLENRWSEIAEGITIQDPQSILSVIVPVVEEPVELVDENPSSEGFMLIVPSEDDNPQYNGWYEIVGGSYILTSDLTVDSNKTYYSYGVFEEDTGSYVLVEPIGDEAPYDETWFELVDGAYIPTEDLIVDNEKTYYVYDPEDVIEDEEDEEEPE